MNTDKGWRVSQEIYRSSFAETQKLGFVWEGGGQKKINQHNTHNNPTRQKLPLFGTNVNICGRIKLLFEGGKEDSSPLLASLMRADKRAPDPVAFDPRDVQRIPWVTSRRRPTRPRCFGGSSRSKLYLICRVEVPSAAQADSREAEVKSPVSHLTASPSDGRDVTAPCLHRNVTTPAPPHPTRPTSPERDRKKKTCSGSVRVINIEFG